MTLRLRLGLGSLALALPLLALAAPANVTGITADVAEGGVRVSWQPVGGSIAGYRIYFSRMSILENGGLFDDYEEADASVNTTTLRNIPPGSELFVSVLAFDASGAESPAFTEEARVVLTAAGGATPSVPADDGTQLRLLTAEAVSATGVLLTFSLPVEIPAAEAQGAIVIEDGSGTLLPLKRLVLQGTALTVHTGVQNRGIVYRVRVRSSVFGKNPQGGAVPLASDQAPLLFTGHAAGAAPGQTARAQGVTSDQAPAGEAGDVVGLHLRGEPEGTSYAVTVRWQAPAGQRVAAGYSLEQTTDGGRSFGPPLTVSSATTETRIAGVPPGTFGVRVTARFGDGTLSRGVLQFIDLPGTLASPPVTGNVTTPRTQTNRTTQNSTTLPNSGPALWVLIGAAGAMAGAWGGKRRKVMG